METLFYYPNKVVKLFRLIFNICSIVYQQKNNILDS